MACTPYCWRQSLRNYTTHRQGGGEALHPYLRRFESCVLQGQAVYRACEQLKQEGWEPDWIINHVGFGNGLYLSDAFPGARRIGLFEWYYNANGADVDFFRRGPVNQIGPCVCALGMPRPCLKSPTAITALFPHNGS